jgi:uncharacterized protein YdhG (YjbR/CyaY superfamily)
MEYKANTPDEYIDQLPEDRKPVIENLRTLINENLPQGFTETMQYGMISWVVPHSLYPKGYHVDPKTPLPFISIASQKNHVAVYHSGVYAHKPLLDWFVNEYPKYVKTKLDMGKSCVRFKNMKTIPYELIGELATKMEYKEYIEIYESHLK